MRPRVFIIILNWNNWPDVLECLESLKDNDYPNYQVVIVDNGSDQKPQVLNQDIKIIYNEKNLGFSGGNNVGIKYALENNADYVLLLNDDTIVSQDFLSKLVEVAENNNKIGIIGPKIYFYNNDVILSQQAKDLNEIDSSALPQNDRESKGKLWSAGGKINWLYNKGEMIGYDEEDKGQYDLPKVQETEFLTGCCVLVKKQAIEKIGLMPEEYFLYYEDTDWSLKARENGFKCVFVPDAKIWHKGSQSSISGSSSYIYYHIRNGLIIAQKYAPWYIKPIIHLDVFYRIIKQIFKMIFMPKKRTWAKYILLGIKDSYFKRLGKYENWH